MGKHGVTVKLAEAISCQVQQMKGVLEGMILPPVKLQSDNSMYTAALVQKVPGKSRHGTNDILVLGPKRTKLYTEEQHAANVLSN